MVLRNVLKCEYEIVWKYQRCQGLYAIIKVCVLRGDWGYDCRWFTRLLVFVIISSLGSFADVHQEKQIPQGPPHHEVTVALKLIQVFVTDRKGNPIPDLRRQDFVVTADGRPVDITEFESHRLLPTTRPVQHVAEPPSPAPPSTSAPSTRLPNKYFLFFDFAYNNHRGISKAKEAALRFLDTKIDVAAEVGVLSLSLMRGLVVHEYLSTDHLRIRETVAALDVGKALSSGRAGDIEEEYWRRMDEADTLSRGRPGVSPGRKSFGELNADRQAAKNQALTVLQRITDLAKALRNSPGQKHFLFFSTGVPGSMIHGYSGYAQASAKIRGNDGSPRGYDFGDPVLRTANEEMFKELATSGCSFFSFDTREAALPTAAASLFAYEEETFGTGNRDIFSEKGVAKPPVGFYKDEKLTGGPSIGRLSERTGGIYFASIDEYEKSLNKVRALTGNYYVLGYRINDEGDGRFHDLRVKVLRKGCEVRAQSGYYGPRPFRDLSETEKGLHLIDLALAGRAAYETPIAIPLLPLAYCDANSTCLDILTKLTPDAMTQFLGQKVEVVTLVFDGRQDLIALRRVETDLPKSEPRDVIALSRFGLGPGRYDCRVVVRDLEKGVAAVASGRAELAEPPTEGLRVFAPLLVRPANPSSIYLESSEGAAKAAETDRSPYVFNRNRFSPILGDEVPAGSANLAAVVPFLALRILALRVDFEANIVNAASGSAFLVAMTSVNKPMVGTTQSVALDFSLAGVPPGSYEFVVSAVDRDSGLTSEGRIPLLIK